MAHPHHAHRAHKVEKERVGHIAGHHHHRHNRAHGGSVSHEDAPEDAALIREMVDRKALKHKRHGGHVEGKGKKHHQGRPGRAIGGRSPKHKGKGKGTNVNVVVAPQQHPGAAAGLGAPMAPPPMMPPRPPMAPPPAPPAGGMAPAGAMPPGLAGPGGPMPPPGLMAPPTGIRRHGGRAGRKHGGHVPGLTKGAAGHGSAGKPGPAFNEGIRAGTQVQHNPSGKTDQKDKAGRTNIGRGPVITRAHGGRLESPQEKHGTMSRIEPPLGPRLPEKTVEAPKGRAMYPHLPAGSGGGKGRLAKERQASDVGAP
jgi:hypothetical protein